MKVPIDPELRYVPELSELLQIFAMSEAEQDAYFPDPWQPIWFRFGDFDTSADDARFLAICALAHKARMHEAGPDNKFASLCYEITGLTHLMIESSVTWPWLMWHPRKVKADNDSAYVVDITLYRIWDVLKRLCMEALPKTNFDLNIRPFSEAFRL
jgi:hypothetical protein